MPPKGEVLPGGHGAIFEADFRLADGKTIEIIIFATDEGNLDFIEVDCNANSEPVPQEVVAPDPPFQIHASASLIMDA